MIYTTIQAVEAEMSAEILAQLAPGDGASGYDEDLLDAVEETAAGELHGYIRGIYALPVASPVDPLVVQTVNELVHYQLYKRRDGANLPDKITELYKAAVARMVKMQRREITLDAAAEELADESQPSSFPYISPAAKFPAGFTKW